MLWIALCAAFAWGFGRLGKRRAKAGTITLCYRGLCRIIGLRVEVQGRAVPERPLLMVSNHISYLDIVALGAVGGIRFTPKLDVDSWPVIGAICRLTDCVFIDRRPARTGENLEALRNALMEGAPVLLFAEGTTGDGKRVLKLRSSYFRLAEEWRAAKPLVIQPLSLRYTRVDGLPLGISDVPRLAWYGDMTLAPHLLELLRMRSIHARLAFQQPIDYQESDGRKVLAERLGTMVESGFEGLR